jgi:hypothetical protein
MGETDIEEALDIRPPRVVGGHFVEEAREHLTPECVSLGDVEQMQRSERRGQEPIESSSDHRKVRRDSSEGLNLVDFFAHPGDLMLGPHGKGGEDVLDHLH